MFFDDQVSLFLGRDLTLRTTQLRLRGLDSSRSLEMKESSQEKESRLVLLSFQKKRG